MESSRAGVFQPVCCKGACFCWSLFVLLSHAHTPCLLALGSKLSRYYSAAPSHRLATLEVAFKFQCSPQDQRARRYFRRAFFLGGNLFSFWSPGSLWTQNWSMLVLSLMTLWLLPSKILNFNFQADISRMFTAFSRVFDRGFWRGWKTKGSCSSLSSNIRAIILKKSTIAALPCCACAFLSSSNARKGIAFSCRNFLDQLLEQHGN